MLVLVEHLIQYLNLFDVVVVVVVVMMMVIDGYLGFDFVVV